MHRSIGYDMPALAMGSLLQGFSPCIERTLMTPLSPSVTARYAFPRLGSEGLLQVTWLEPSDREAGRYHGIWHHDTWQAVPGELPVPGEMGDCPLWLVVALGEFVALIAKGQETGGGR